MAHLPDPRLKFWESGDPLFAVDLSYNFAAIHGLVETTMARAKQPDPDALAALAAVRIAVSRIEALERREAASEREKNERAYTPLAAHGALLRQMQQLAGPLRQAAAELQAEHGTQRIAQGQLDQRVAALEAAPGAPAAPSVEAFAALLKRVQALETKPE